MAGNARGSDVAGYRARIARAARPMRGDGAVEALRADAPRLRKPFAGARGGNARSHPAAQGA